MTKITATANTSWINAVSNDSAAGLDIGLASMSLTSSFSGVCEDYALSGLPLQTKARAVTHVKDNDDLDYSTCSESGNETPPERSSTYLSPIGVNNNPSSNSSPLQRPVPSSRNELFRGGERLPLLEVRSDRAENNDVSPANRSYFLGSGSCNNNDRATTISSNISRGKDEGSLSSIGSDFCYSGNAENDFVRNEIVDRECVEPLNYLSARGRAKSVPILTISSPVNNNGVVERPGGIPQMPFSGTWEEINRRNRGESEILDDGKLFNEAKVSSMTLLEGLRRGTVPVEDNGHTLDSAKGCNVQENPNSNFFGFLKQNDQSLCAKGNVPVTSAHPNNTNTEIHGMSPSSVNALNSYSQLGPCHQVRHSMSDVFTESRPNEMRTNVLSPRSLKDYYEDSRYRPSHFVSEENNYQSNGNHYVEEGTRGGGDNGNFVQHVNMQNRHDQSQITANRPYQMQHFHSKPSFSSAQPHVQMHSNLTNSSQSVPQYHGQSEMNHLGHPSGFNEFHSNKYPENPQRSYMVTERRRMSDPRVEPHSYRSHNNTSYGPPPRVVVSNHNTASTPPPLVPRSYGEEYDSSPIRVSCNSGMTNPRVGGHHRVLSCNSVGNHSHSGVTINYQNRVHAPEVESRVRCHSYGGQGSMQPNYRGDLIHTVMHPSRYEYHQTEHHTMLLPEPVMVNNEAEYHSVASSASHSLDYHGAHMPTNAYKGHSCVQDYQSNSDLSVSNRCNNFVTTRTELPNTLTMSSVPMNQVPNTLMVRSVSSNPNERQYESCSHFVNIEDYDEANIANNHPQFVFSHSNPPTHFNRPHSSSTSSLERLQAIPQFVGSEASAVPAIPRVVYNVKFKRTQRSFIPGPRVPREIKIGCYVKVEADRGEDLGFVVSRIPAEKFNASGRSNFRVSAGVDGTDSSSSAPLSGSAADLKRVVRLATREEVALIAAKREEEDELLKICRAKVKNRGLAMNVVDAEYQFDRHKLTFFFEAEGRIDFRELVRDLFSIYKTRIWMQQLDKNGVGIGNDACLDDNNSNDTNGFPPPEVVINSDVFANAE